MSEYRDPLAGVRDQVAAKRAVALEQLGRLTPFRRAILPKALREAITELEVRARLDGESLDVLTRAEAALDALLPLCDQALATLPSLVQCEDIVPSPPAPKEPEPWLLEEPFILEFRDVLYHAVMNADPKAALLRWGDWGYMAELHEGDIPLKLVAIAYPGLDSEHRLAGFKACLRTTVPDRTPELVLKPQRLHHAIGKAVHLIDDLEIGSPAFDDAFLVRGQAASVGLLTADVADALFTMRPLLNNLTVHRGVAELAYGSHDFRSEEAVVPAAGIATLVALRRAMDLP